MRLPTRVRWRRAGPPLLAACLLLGTLVRLWFGLRQHGWLSAPDQLAWGLILSEGADGPLRFDRLLHYPHEGATPLLSLLALGLEWLPAALPPLSWAALLVDTAARAVQIVVVDRVLGRRAAVAFGVWTVAAVPGVVPWATVNFGLHALSGFWPFVLLWAAARYGGTTRDAVRLGVLLGLVELAARVAAAFGKTLPGASLLPAFGPIPLAAVRFGWLALCAAGIAFALRPGAHRERERRTVAFGAAVVVTYLFAYAASPFFAGSGGQSGYMYYRHLPYILPLFVALGLRGLVAVRRAAPAVALIAVSVIGSTLTLMHARAPDRALYAPTGWIVAQKLGHDPDRSGRLLERAPGEARPELAEGYGAGIAADGSNPTRLARDASGGSEAVWRPRP